MMAKYAVEAPHPPMPCMYDDDDGGLDEMDVYFNEIEAFLHCQSIPPPPASLPTTPRPMPSAKLLAPPPDMNSELSRMLRRGIKIAAPDHRAPFSHGDDINAAAPDEASSPKNKNKKIMEDPSWTYEDDIDATFRKMETNPAERPSEDNDLWAMHKMTMSDRASLVESMYACSRIRRLPPGTLHRAVSYLDRYLSVKKIHHQEHRLLLAITTVFAAAKYESRTSASFNADDVTRDVGNGCTRSHVLAMERDLVATLGYNLSGPTAHTFVDHFTRHDDQEEVIRSLAHHLADVALLDYRCVHSLPSAVAASAILLARRVIINCDEDEEELLKKMGYKVEDLTDIIDAIYEMHELQGVWPGCALMMANRACGYYLPPRYC